MQYNTKIKINNPGSLKSLHVTEGTAGHISGSPHIQSIYIDYQYWKLFLRVSPLIQTDWKNPRRKQVDVRQLSSQTETGE